MLDTITEKLMRKALEATFAEGVPIRIEDEGGIYEITLISEPPPDPIEPEPIEPEPLKSKSKRWLCLTLAATLAAAASLAALAIYYSQTIQEVLNKWQS